MKGEPLYRSNPQEEIQEKRETLRLVPEAWGRS